MYILYNNVKIRHVIFQTQKFQYGHNAKASNKHVVMISSIYHYNHFHNDYIIKNIIY